MKMPAIWSKEGCLVRRKKVLLVVFPVVVLSFGREGVPDAWCLVRKIEDLERIFGVWRKKAPNEKEVALGQEGVEVYFSPDAHSTLRKRVYTWVKV